MKFFWNAVLGCLTAFLCSTPTIAQTQPIGLMDEQPVIQMEQFHVPRYIPHYRIEIYENGDGLYEGLDLVREKSSIKFKITRDEVEKIQEEFKQLGFWEMPLEFSSSRAPRYNGKAHRFTLRQGAKTKVALMHVSDESWPKRYIFREIIERHVRSSQWRCPYQHDDSTEVCWVEKGYSDQAIQFFENGKKGESK